MTAALPAIEAARKAKQAETPDVVKNIRRAVDVLLPFAKKGAEDSKWAASWNEAITLSRFHGYKPPAEYAMDAKGIPMIALSFGLPKGRGWTFEEKSPGKNEQCWGTILRTTADGRIAAFIAVSAYQFNTSYSGTDGASASGLAKMAIEYDRRRMTKIDSGGTQIAVKALSKSFGRAHCYEIVGLMEKAGQVRLRCAYVKTSVRTLLFETTQFRETTALDAPCEAWQKGVDDPELEAVLESLEETDSKK
jgi:hypothetical protein